MEKRNKTPLSSSHVNLLHARKKPSRQISPKFYKKKSSVPCHSLMISSKDNSERNFSCPFSLKKFAVKNLEEDTIETVITEGREAGGDITLPIFPLQDKI